MVKKVEISHRTIVFTVFFLIFLWLLVQIQQVILGLFVGLIVMAALNPLVDKLGQFRISRSMAIFLIFIILLGGFLASLSLIISPLVSQTATLISKLPTDLPYFRFFGIDVSLLLDQLVKLGTLPADLVRLTIGIFSNFVNILATLVIAFYLLMERKNLDQYLLVLFGEGQEKKAKAVVDKIEDKLGSWIRGQLMLMIIVGVLDFIGLKLLGIEFALPIAVLGGLLEIIPNFGPMLATVPAILAGLTISWPHTVAVAGWFFLVQQVENTLIVPKVMQKATGVNPLITILALVIGFKLGGILGAILGVPIFLTAQVILSEVFALERFPGA